MTDEHDFVMTDEVFERIKHSIHDEPYNYRFPTDEELSKLPGFENLDPPQRILKFLNDDELLENYKVPNEHYIEGYKEKK